MNLSLKWLNDYLSPANLGPAEAEDVLMNLGFPVESWANGTDGTPDRFDLEVTSNRGDCLCHVGAAREVAAKTGRALVLKTGGLTAPGQGEKGPVSQTSASVSFKVANQAPEGCPLFMARVIRGVRVGASPAWLRERLESVGQRSVNNIVDVTNFINFELGNPCHAFDLAKLEGSSLIIRWAHDKEELTTLDGKKRVLKIDELVVADSRRAQSLAGVIGGAASEVSMSTTDVVLEVATWEPGVVRRAARRHGVRTDASHRFERLVDARTLAAALERGAALIAEVGAGSVAPGTFVDGRPLPEPTRIRFRPTRCSALLGVDVAAQDSVAALNSVGVEVSPIGRAGEELSCTIPAHRPDLSREVDLFEEVARVRGLDAIPINQKIAVAVRAPQPQELARQAISSLLTGLGFYETITFSFTSVKEAELFVSGSLKTILVDDERRGGEPVLRPSVLIGLLTCRRNNQHAQVRVPGGVRLFEVGSVFAQDANNTTEEHSNLALLMDVPTKGKTATPAELQHGLRVMRGVIESLVHTLAGPLAALQIKGAVPHAAAFEAGAYAAVSLAGTPLGYYGAVSGACQAAYDLGAPGAGAIVGAELNLKALVSAYPPKGMVEVLPAFPGIERDLSVVVGDSVSWTQVDAAVRAAAKPPFTGVEFVGTFRGAQLGAGKKSVTLRLTYRDPARTLRHEEVDEPLAGVVAALKAGLGAELRA